MLTQLLLFNGIASTKCFNSSDFSELSQSGHFCTLRRYIFKIALSENKKKRKKMVPNKKTFSKLLPQKIHFRKLHFQSFFIKKFNFVILIHSKELSESKSSKELSTSSIVCLTTFFLMYLHYFEKTCR